jgi:hypothetical protein
MKRRQSRNRSLTSTSEHRGKIFLEGVVKRGSNAKWTAFRRFARCVTKVSLLAAFCVGAYWASTAGYQKFFWRNPTYTLTDVRFTTDGSLTRQQAIDVTKFHPGNNIFSYKVDIATEALNRLPQVESCKIRRYLPNRLEINVVERKPVAWVTARLSKDPGTSPHSHLVDARALVFEPKDTPHEYDSLPVIGGVVIGDLEPGKPIHKAEVVATIDLLRKVGATSQFKVRAVDVSKGYCVVVTDHKNSQLTFGLDDIDGQLLRLSAVENEVALIGQEIQTINLMPTRNVPVTFKIPPPPEDDDIDAPEPAPSPKAKTPPATKPGNSISRDKSQPVLKKFEPSKSKDSPRKEGNGVLKRFQSV